MAKGKAQPGRSLGATIARAVFGFIGICLGLFCVALAVSAAGDLITGDSETSKGTLLGLVALFTGGSFWAFNLARTSFGWRLPRLRWSRSERPEQRILELATSVGGRVTIVEVAGRCQLTLEESEKLLNRFVLREVAELLIAEDGTTVYDFDVLTHKEKQRAKEII